MLKQIILLVATVALVNCQEAKEWEQCAGNGVKKACQSGLQCVYLNDWYSQCLKQTAQDTTKQAATTTTQAPTTTKQASTTTKQASTTPASTTQKLTTTTKLVQSTTSASSSGSGSGVGTVLKGVHTTRHPAVEVGACSLPEGQYIDNIFPVALGDIPELGSLGFKSELCGHILQINCGNGPVNLIVSNSNLGGGLDLYKSSWDKATNALPPGITHCDTQLTSLNPLKASGPVCYYATGETTNEYYNNVGLINTNDRLVVSATLNGVNGAHRGTNPYFAFDGKAVKSDIVTFKFQDGTTHSVPLKDCLSGESKHIWS